MESASPAFCSTRNIVVPKSRFKSENRLNSSCVTIGASPSDGSSSNNIFGRDISARATASICCSPPLKLPAATPRRSPSRGNTSSQRCTSFQTSSWSLRMYAPACRFSSTVSSGNVPRPCGTCATPRRTIQSGGLPTSSVPSNRTEPFVSTMPHSARSVVVFPAPFAPSSTTISPSLTTKSRPCSTATGPYEALRSLTVRTGSLMRELRGRPR